MANPNSADRIGETDEAAALRLSNNGPIDGQDILDLAAEIEAIQEESRRRIAAVQRKIDDLLARLAAALPMDIFEGWHWTPYHQQELPEFIQLLIQPPFKDFAKNSNYADATWHFTPQHNFYGFPNVEAAEKALRAMQEVWIDVFDISVIRRGFMVSAHFVPKASGKRARTKEEWIKEMTPIWAAQEAERRANYDEEEPF